MRYRPARPVWIDLAKVFPIAGRPTRSVPNGLDLQVRVPGTLSAWQLTTTGDWVGYCKFDVRHGTVVIGMSQWIPAAALQKRDDQLDRRRP
ncbi:hypothetical protein [Kutzneria sp. NPDC051319]|uniref:hypothetical protein n=1 Tax=Kutzneria sp. NPDC051319 TaxID=3155047 RepID=UPI00341634DA